MIGKLSGRVDTLADDWAIIDVGGVGYQVFGAPRLLAGLAPGEAARLTIETIVREDMIKLYGFADEAERACFKALQGVQGVGAKHALSVLNVLRPSEIADAAALADWAAVARAHGVGKKLAQRIVAELKSAPGFQMPAARAANDGAPAPASSASEISAVAASRADALSALLNLGYGEADAARAVAAARAKFDGDPSVEDWIKSALKEASAA